MTAPLAFAWDRSEDVHDVSGVGIVAYGWQFPTGLTIVRWLSDTPSVEIWPSLEMAAGAHGHDGRTRIVAVPLDATDRLTSYQEALLAVTEAFAVMSIALPDVRARDALEGGVQP